MEESSTETKRVRRLFDDIKKESPRVERSTR
jgi:hypothetical protein